MPRPSLLCLASLLLPYPALSLSAQEADAAPRQVQLRPEELFAADEAGPYRHEALFRLSMMLGGGQERWADAAVLLRQNLDEAPHSARVRVELARTQALTARRPVGGCVQRAIAPDSNINRTTRADTLETVIGDFTNDTGTRETSRIGLSVQGQVFARTGIGRHADLLARASASGDFYRGGQFNDVVLAAWAEPRYRLGGGRLDLVGTPAHRRFGGAPFSLTAGVSGGMSRPLSPTRQLRVTGTPANVDNRRNDLQDGTQISLRAGADAASDARSGGGASLSGYRLSAADPGYAPTNGEPEG